MTCARRERWAPMVEEKPKLRRSSGGMRRTALSLGARGESSGRRELAWPQAIMASCRCWGLRFLTRCLSQTMPASSSR